MKELGDNIPNMMVISAILCSLNAEYTSLATSLEAWKEDQLTLETVTMELMNKWKRKNEATNKRRVQGDAKKQPKCFYCKKKGHIKRYCPQLKKDSTLEMKLI